MFSACRARSDLPGRLSLEEYWQLTEALFARGFDFEARPGMGGMYEAHQWWEGLAPLNEAEAAFRTSPGWALNLWTTLESGERVNVLWGAQPPHPSGAFDPQQYLGLHAEPVTVLFLSTDWFVPEPAPFAEFRAWLRELVPLVGPCYGQAGGEGGLFGTCEQPPSLTGILHAEPPPLNWWTCYGPPFIERLGEDRLLRAPAWAVERQEEEFVVFHTRFPALPGSHFSMPHQGKSHSGGVDIRSSCAVDCSAPTDPHLRRRFQSVGSGSKSNQRLAGWSPAKATSRASTLTRAAGGTRKTMLTGMSFPTPSAPVWSRASRASGYRWR
jgi:hypothetical protein